jgi:hypothetical protein
MGQLFRLYKVLLLRPFTINKYKIFFRTAKFGKSNNEVN